MTIFVCRFYCSINQYAHAFSPKLGSYLPGQAFVPSLIHSFSCFEVPEVQSRLQHQKLLLLFHDEHVHELVSNSLKTSSRSSIVTFIFPHEIVTKYQVLISISGRKKARAKFKKSVNLRSRKEWSIT